MGEQSHDENTIPFLLLGGPFMVVSCAEGRNPVAASDENPDEEHLERRIDELDAMLDRLERNLKNARKETQAELKKKLPELRVKERELRKDLQDCRNRATEPGGK